MDSRITLYPFRKRDELTGKWDRARWKASLEEIAKLGGVVDGEPEMREGDDWGAGFAPYRDPPKPLALANVESDITRTLDAAERDFARIFLRRYITWCVRRGRHAQAHGAGALWRELG